MTRCEDCDRKIEDMKKEIKCHFCGKIALCTYEDVVHDWICARCDYGFSMDAFR